MMLLTCSMLAGCQTGRSGTSDVACRTFDPIAASRQDTPGTIRQVVAHNGAYRALCP